MAKPNVACIIVSWKLDPTTIINNMINQTYPNKHLMIICSDIDIKPLKKKFPKCEFFDVPYRGDWGYSSRAAGIEFLPDKSKYVCFCNSDDVYELQFLELMVGALEAERADFAYCNWFDRAINFEIANAELAKGGITNSSFVVKSDIAKKVGIKNRLYASDWYFVRDMLKEKMQVVYMPYSLLKHN